MAFDMRNYSALIIQASRDGMYSADNKIDITLSEALVLLILRDATGLMPWY